jgi:gamma-glutamyl-gamma-aminobutyrate hydrolase PuuD
MGRLTVAKKLETLSKPTPMTETNPNIIGWKRPRVYIVGTQLVSDVKSMFLKFGYLPVTGWFPEKRDDIDFLCFTGGSDLHPRLYGQTKDERTHADPERDSREIAAYFQYSDLPKVGICRGLQLINVLHGGQMIQHVDGHNGPEHEIRDVWGNTHTVSSVHHQMIIPPSDGTAHLLGWSKGIAYKGDFVEPEVMWYPETFSLGVQGHPEWGPESFTKYFMLLIKEFVLPMTSYKSRGAESPLLPDHKVIH